MRTKLILAVLVLGALSAPAFAASYPVQGKWGESKTSQKGAIDCSKVRVVAFNGEERTDSGGSVPAFRNLSVTPQDGTTFRIVDIFSNGQVRNGRVNYTLSKVDDDRVDLNMQPGGLLKLQRCK